MKKKARVVLILDHPERDLRGIALIAYWLSTQYDILPVITTTKNEMACLIKHKPSLILFQHLRHKRQFEILEFAKDQGVHIAVSLAEGFPNHPDNILFSIGPKELHPYIDLFLPWGPDFVNNSQNTSTLTNAKIVPTGSPRFDYHTPRFSSLLASREEFTRHLNLKGDTPIILWVTSTKYSNPPEGPTLLIESIKNPMSSDHRIAHVIEPKVRDHQRVYEYTMDLFTRLIQEKPELHYIVKIHPRENYATYYERLHRYENVTLLHNAEEISISDLIRHCSVQLNFRCTTSPESWMMNVDNTVMSIEPPRLELDEFEYLASGNKLIETYDQLKTNIEQSLREMKRSPEIRQKRMDFIQRFLVSNDGSSAERCAAAIHQQLQTKRKTEKRRLRYYKTFIKYAKFIRPNNRWLISKRLSDHPKFVSKERFHGEIKKIETLFKKQSSYLLDF